MDIFLRTRDYLVSGEEFDLRYNKEKDLLITDPRPEDLLPYYKSEEYISHTDSSSGVVPTMYQWAKRHSIKSKLKLINRYSGEDRSLLDVGAGTAELLIAAKERGYRIGGVEPNLIAVQKAASKGIHLEEEIVFEEKFKVVTMWHVMEHLPDPSSTIQKVKEVLHDEGVLMVAVPNFKSYDATFYKEHWAAYDVPRHLWHFSKKSIESLFQENQMSVFDVKPMPLDAYYISLLSEKYKNGRNNFIKAFYIGLLSNIKARRNGNYSSLLYLIKKDKQDI